MESQSISPDFPFASHFIEINGSKMHYIDEGEGDPILFLHGNPTSSYLWRNVIPHVTPYARCIAPDLIGMGKSDKPDIEYRFVDHVKYVNGFIKKMELNNLTLVMHDWGSALGFHFATRYGDKIKGLVFMEAIVRTAIWQDFPKEFQLGFRLFRTPVIGWFLIAVMNIFVEQILPKATVRTLSKKEMDNYRKPFITVKDRRLVHRWPNEIPINGNPPDVTDIVRHYSRELQKNKLSKLLFYAEPGGIIRAKTLNWCRQNFKNLTTVNIGKGIHYLQEDNPYLIGEKIAQWYRTL